MRVECTFVAYKVPTQKLHMDFVKISNFSLRYQESLENSLNNVQCIPTYAAVKLSVSVELVQTDANWPVN